MADLNDFLGKNTDFPFNRPGGSDLDMFIQWKGTDLCADFTCDCGYDGHIDGDYAYFVRCGGCGAVYEMGTQVIAKRVDGGETASPPKTFLYNPYDPNDTGETDA